MLQNQPQTLVSWRYQPESANGIIVINTMSDSAHSPSLAIFLYVLSNTYMLWVTIWYLPFSSTSYIVPQGWFLSSIFSHQWKYNFLWSVRGHSVLVSKAIKTTDGHTNELASLMYQIVLFKFSFSISSFVWLGVIYFKFCFVFFLRKQLALNLIASYWQNTK